MLGCYYINLKFNYHLLIGFKNTLSDWLNIEELVTNKKKWSEELKFLHEVTNLYAISFCKLQDMVNFPSICSFSTYWTFQVYARKVF